MKILVTGFSSQQCGTVPKLGYVVIPDVIRQALTDAGHEVEYRRVAYDEDVSKFDVVFIGLIPPLSFAAHKVYSTLKLMHNLGENHQTPVVLYVDDPSYYKFSHNLNTVSRGIDRQFRASVFSRRPDYAVAMEEKQLFLTLVERLRDPGTWPPCLVPAYEWGDRAGMRNVPERSVFGDPSGYVPDYPFTVAAERKRSWVLGALVNAHYWLGKQTIGWPVDSYGPNLTRNIATLTEADLNQRFAECWGILCQPRPEVRGSGWWRSRYLFAARTGAVLSGEVRDLTPLGDPYTQATPQRVEAMADGELAELAAAQAAIFNDHVWGRERFKTLIDATAVQARDERWGFTWR